MNSLQDLASDINLFELLPPTLIQNFFSEKVFSNLDQLYQLNFEIRLSLLDLTRIRKLQFYHGFAYAAGYGRNGQLGHGVNFDKASVPIPTDIDKIGQKKIVQVSSGNNHSLYLCDDGSVYSTGHGVDGVLGDGRVPTHIQYTPTLIDSSRIDEKCNIIQVSAGGGHSLFLCDDGTVYAAGSNEFHQLGLANVNEYLQETPSPVDSSKIGSKRVVQVSAGENHSLFLCDDGSVYACGYGELGVLGNGRIEEHDVEVPSLVDASNMKGKRVIQVSTGMAHSLFLCDDGSVYACGMGKYGALGTGNIRTVAIPTLIDSSNMESNPDSHVNQGYQGKQVIQVSAGSYHSLFLCDDGTVYTCGDKFYDSLQALISARSEKSTPVLIDSSPLDGKEVIQVSAGDGSTYLLCKDGTVYANGKNPYGNLGVGSLKDTILPFTLVDTKYMNNDRTFLDGRVRQKHKVIQVSASMSHALFLT